MRKLIVVIGLLSVLFTTAFSSPRDSFKWQVGEKLIYKVSWGFIRLGTLRVSVIDTVQIDGQNSYHVRLRIDSNPRLFFIDMHSQFDSYLLDNAYPLLLICQETIDGVDYSSRYEFDYTTNTLGVHYEGVDNPGVQIERLIPFTEQLQDGMSMIFYARLNCHQQKKEQLTVFYEAREGKLDISFNGLSDSITISKAIDPNPTYYLDGKAHFKAIAGFRDDFEGWFSSDARRIPLAARMKVFIGSVYLELEECENCDGL